LEEKSMTGKTTTGLALALALVLSLGACGDGGNAGGDNAASPTPPENISEAEPKGTGGTSNN
jgi:hypothetical protein